MHILHSTCWKKTIILNHFQVITLLGKEHNNIFASHRSSWCEKTDNPYIHCKTCMYATMDRFSPVCISIIISNFCFFISFLFVYWERNTIIIAIFLWCFKVGSDQVPTDWLADTDWLTNQLSDWLVEQLTGWLAEWFTNWLTQLTDGGMDRCTDLLYM